MYYAWLLILYTSLPQCSIPCTCNSRALLNVMQKWIYVAKIVRFAITLINKSGSSATMLASFACNMNLKTVSTNRKWVEIFWRTSSVRYCDGRISDFPSYVRIGGRTWGQSDLISIVQGCESPRNNYGLMKQILENGIQDFWIWPCTRKINIAFRPDIYYRIKRAGSSCRATDMHSEGSRSILDWDTSNLTVECRDRSVFKPWPFPA